MSSNNHLNTSVDIAENMYFLFCLFFLFFFFVFFFCLFFLFLFLFFFLFFVFVFFFSEQIRLGILCEFELEL